MPARSVALYRRSAAIGLLTVEGNHPEHFVRAGESFERLWLTAALHRLGLQPLGGLTFLVLRQQLGEAGWLSAPHQRLAAAMTERLSSLAGLRGRYVAMAFRIGQAPPPSARTLRRALADVFARSNGTAHD
jgi:hypothetical protein